MNLFGAKIDIDDPRDKRYVANDAIRLTKQDLRYRLPQVWNQFHIGACEGFAGAALMNFLFPNYNMSPLALYYEARQIDGTTNIDGGVQTRSMMKALHKFGAVEEDDWPYRTERVFDRPPMAVNSPKLAIYSRMQGEDEFLNCLSDGYPFVMSFRVPQSFSSPELAGHGVFWWPDEDPATLTSAHAVLAVGYDLDFKANRTFLRSGVDQERVSDRALLVRNSWGSYWGDRGHFWMPIEWASNRLSGGDAWFGHKLITHIDEPEGARVAGIKIDGHFI